MIELRWLKKKKCETPTMSRFKEKVLQYRILDAKYSENKLIATWSKWKNVPIVLEETIKNDN